MLQNNFNRNNLLFKEVECNPDTLPEKVKAPANIYPENLR